MSKREVVAIMACFLLANCAGPSSLDYRRAAERHAHWAEEARQGASEDEAAARALAEHGDQTQAGELGREQAAFTRRAQWEQFQADKDWWLSSWWPTSR